MFKQDNHIAIAKMAAGAVLVWLTTLTLLPHGVQAQRKAAARPPTKTTAEAQREAAAKATDEAQPGEISIESFSLRGEFVRHRDSKGFVNPILTPLDSRDARFKKVPGLADAKGVSFESTNYPGRFLRQRSGRLTLTACPEALDKQDATFLVKKGLAGYRDGWISLGLLNLPGHFLRVRNGELWTGPQEDGADFQKSATFRFEKPVSPGNPPAHEWTERDVQLFDALMLKYGAKIGCTSAELAIARNRVVILSRGYGSSDRFGRVPMHPNNPMAIGSCEKPITAAVVKQLARAGKLDLNASVFKVLEVQPVGQIVDSRVWDVTIQHVLDHKAGWQGAPLDQAMQAARARGFKDNVTEIWLRFLMAQRLKDAPGAKEEYSNFGYDVLRLLIARTTGRPVADYVRHELCRPYGFNELREIQSPGVEIRGEPPQVWNARSVDFDFYPLMPASPLRASAPALCTFMSCFWLTGEPRDNGNWFWTMDGSTDNTTAQMCWRVDEKFPEFDYAFIFNGRREGAGHDQIQADLKQVFKTVLGVK